MKGIIFGICIGLSTSCMGQYFQYSQYNFTRQRINPAQVGSTDYASVSFDYRNQATGGGFHLNSNILSAEYPLLSRAGVRWAGIGISVMDDRSGHAGIFATQEVGVSYAITLQVARQQHLSLGIKALYQNRKVDLDGLYTGSQYIADRGFDESVSSGEDLGLLKNNFMTFSTGLYWSQVDKQDDRIAYAGISFFDFNKPEDSFLGSSTQLNSTFVGAFGFRIYQRGNVSVFPEVLYTHTASTNLINAGAIIRTDLVSSSIQSSSQVDLIFKYVVTRSGILGLQFHKEKFSLGISYDFPVFTRNVANTGAFELGLELRQLVRRKKKSRKASAAQALQAQTGKKLGASVGVKPPQPLEAKSAADSVDRKAGVKESLALRLKQKQDSIIAQANAGRVTHEPLVLEKATLHFNFEFNSTQLDDNARNYLNELVSALADNPELKIQLIGHTDNIGSAKFNLGLSVHRAQTLKDYLVGKGISPARIHIDGRGMQEPLNGNESESDRSANRRVELTIVYGN